MAAHLSCQVSFWTVPKTTLLAQEPGDAHLLALPDFFENMRDTTTTTALRSTHFSNNASPPVPFCIPTNGVPPLKYAYLYMYVPNNSFLSPPFVKLKCEKEEIGHWIQVHTGKILCNIPQAGKTLACLQPTCCSILGLPQATSSATQGSDNLVICGKCKSSLSSRTQLLLEHSWTCWGKGH